MKPAPLVLAFALLSALPGHPASLEVTINDSRGAPVDDVVVWATPKSGTAPLRRRPVAAVEQKDRQFVPMVTVVQKGSPVRFPNRDAIRHHVYSFSQAKSFEIKLYAGMPDAPIVFDKAGEVVVGCNIHDHMLAFVYVVDTPYFAKSARDGMARIEAMPAGEYELHVWHFAQAAAQAPQVLRLRGDEHRAVRYALPIKPPVARSTPQ